MYMNHDVIYKGGGVKKGNESLCCIKWGIRERETIMA